jgi:hypothetical protein
MKKVKLKDVSSKGWMVKKGDRASLNTARVAASTSEAVDRMVQIAEINTEFLKKLGEAVDKFLANSPKALPPVQAQAPPKIEVIVPINKEKKKFRCTPVRDEHGLMEYIDIEQL